MVLNCAIMESRGKAEDNICCLILFVQSQVQ